MDNPSSFYLPLLHEAGGKVHVQRRRDDACQETIFRLTLPSGRSETISISDTQAGLGLGGILQTMRHRLWTAINDMLAAEARERAAYERMQECEL